MGIKQWPRRGLHVKGRKESKVVFSKEWQWWKNKFLTKETLGT
jgi:hypothetical protein